MNLGDPRRLRHDGNPASLRQEVEVDICPEQAGFILSVGPLSIWLDGTTAEEVVEMLERAIEARTVAARPATLTARGVRGPHN
jgi:hypothetical protein